MTVLANRVKVDTATTGTGTVTLGSASSNAFLTFAEAGVSNGDVVRYCIEDGTDFEIGVGTYTSSGTTLSRDTVTISKVSGTAGTTKITLSGSATVRIVAAKEDLYYAGGTDVAIADGGTGASTAATAFGNLKQSATGSSSGVITLGDTLVAGTAQNTTSGTSFDFTSIPSWVKKITITLSAVSLSGTDNILIQIGDSGGIETTSYVSGSNTTNGSTSAVQTVSSTSGFVIQIGNASHEATGTMTLVNVTGNSWVSSHAGYRSTSLATHGGGRKTLSATLDRVRLTRDGTDTFDAGTVNILYE